jgi:hypothetical protein
MALGDQSRALRIVSINKWGFDPMVIQETTSPEGKVYPAHDISKFNKIPETWKLGDQSVGSLPEDIPANQNQFAESKSPQYSESITFETPDVSRENANRRTSNADPTPDMPGA